MIVFCERRMTDHMREDLALSGIAQHSYLLNRTNVYIYIYIYIYHMALCSQCALSYLRTCRGAQLERRQLRYKTVLSQNQKMLENFI